MRKAPQMTPPLPLRTLKCPATTSWIRCRQMTRSKIPPWIATSHLLSTLFESGTQMHQVLHISLGGKEKMCCCKGLSRVEEMLDKISTDLEVYRGLITNEITKHIVEETNRCGFNTHIHLFIYIYTRTHTHRVQVSSTSQG